MTHTQLPHSAIPRGFCIVLVYPSRPCHYDRRRKETGKETVAPLGIISCVTLLYWLVSCAHLGKRTLSLPRLLCFVDVVLVVTFLPFCSDRVLLFLLTLLTAAKLYLSSIFIYLKHVGTRINLSHCKEMWEDLKFINTQIKKPSHGCNNNPIVD